MDIFNAVRAESPASESKWDSTDDEQDDVVESELKNAQNSNGPLTKPTDAAQTVPPLNFVSRDLDESDNDGAIQVEASQYSGQYLAAERSRSQGKRSKAQAPPPNIGFSAMESPESCNPPPAPPKRKSKPQGQKYRPRPKLPEVSSKQNTETNTMSTIKIPEEQQPPAVYLTVEEEYNYPEHPTGEAEMSTPESGESDMADTVQLYHFDSVKSSANLLVHNNDDHLTLKGPVTKAAKILRRIWRELFLLISILSSLLIYFVLEAVQFVFARVFQTLLGGLIRSFGDSLAKPLLTALYNGIFHPFGIFFWNVFLVFEKAISPLLRVLRAVCESLAVLFSSIRLIDLHFHRSSDTKGTFVA